MRYRSLTVFSLGPWSARLQPKFLVLRSTWVYSQRPSVFVYGAFTCSGALFQHASTNFRLSYSVEAQQRFLRISRYPLAGNGCCLAPVGFGLSPLRSPLLGGSLRFLFLRLLRCFTSPGSSPCGVMGLLPWGCPIQISADLCLLAAPRGVSPLAASFFGCKCQGIRSMPLLP